MEANTLTVGGRKRLHLGDPSDVEPHAYLHDPSMGGAGPRFTVASSDPTVAVVGDGGDYRLAVLAVGTAAVDRTATLTITRTSDAATFSLVVTVIGVPVPEPEPGFSVHLGETF
jgi:hypothetical protein